MVKNTSRTDDIENQINTENYAYDEIGNLNKDEAEEIQEIKWNVAGKVTDIIRKAGSTKCSGRNAES